MRLLNKSGKLLVTHSSGGDSIQKILKLAFKDKEPFLLQKILLNI